MANSVEQSTKITTPLPGSSAQQLHNRHTEAVARGVSTLMPTFAQKAGGGIVEDVDGNRFVDFGSGIAVTTVGASAPEVVEAISRQAENFTHTCYMITPYEGYVEVCERLNDLVPISGETRSALFNSGAEAVENAVKIARAATGKTAIAALDHAYHGRTSLTMGLTYKNKPYKSGFGPFAPDIYRVTGSYPLRDGLDGEAAATKTIAQLEKEIGTSNLAAIIIEPIQGEGGFIVPAPGYLSRISQWCTENEVIFIADEVQSGIARTGKWFACQHEGVEPDLITIAKGVAGGMPLSAVTGRADIMDAPQPGGLGGTYGGNPVSCAAALATLSLIEDGNLNSRAEAIEKVFVSRLEKLQQEEPRIAEIRGRGAMIAIEISDPESGEPLPQVASDVALTARNEGVITLTCGTDGNVIRFLPPLSISDELINEGLDIISAAFRKHS